MLEEIKKYIQYFESKDIEGIRKMMLPEISLQDPNAGLVEGLDKVLEIYRDIFQNEKIEVDLKRTYSNGPSDWAFEFVVTLIDQHGHKVNVEGIDLVKFKGNKILSIRFYLDHSIS